MQCNQFIDGKEEGKNARERATNKCNGGLKLIRGTKTVSSGLVRRRYECGHCKKRITTYEIRNVDLLRLSFALDQVNYVKEALFPKTLTSSIKAQLKREILLELAANNKEIIEE